MDIYQVQGPHRKTHKNSTRKHPSSGEVPRKSSAMRRYSSTSDGQSASSKGPKPSVAFPNLTGL